jgi:hypothetical protein
VDDRTVHAENRTGLQIVRYDRTGKWYQELGSMPRIQLTVDEAAKAACNVGMVWHEGLPGGRMFDNRVRRRKGIG